MPNEINEETEEEKKKRLLDEEIRRKNQIIEAQRREEQQRKERFRSILLGQGEAVPQTVTTLQKTDLERVVEQEEIEKERQREE